MDRSLITDPTRVRKLAEALREYQDLDPEDKDDVDETKDKLESLPGPMVSQGPSPSSKLQPPVNRS